MEGQIMKDLLEPWFVQVGLFVLSAISNIVRHDSTKIPRTEHPKIAYLTVHTIFLQCVCNLAAVVDVERLRWLVYGCDSFLIALGTLLFWAYYLLVHRDTHQAIVWNHVVHFPVMIIPILSAWSKSPLLLSQHKPDPRSTVALAFVYSVIYVLLLYRMKKQPPVYSFMSLLTGTKSRLAFWGAGILFIVLPLTLASIRLVDFFSSVSYQEYRKRNFKAALRLLLLSHLTLFGIFLLDGRRRFSSLSARSPETSRHRPRK